MTLPANYLDIQSADTRFSGGLALVGKANAIGYAAASAKFNFL